MWGLGCLLAGLFLGCASVGPPDAVVESGISRTEIRSHHARLNAPRFLGRRTATVGYSEAARYVAERLGGLGIQPMHPGEYRHLTHQPINHISGLSIRTLSPDSSIWIADRSMIPDPRSGSLRAQITSVVRLEPRSPPPAARRGQAAIVDSVLSDSFALSLAEAGFGLAFVVRAPSAGRASRQLPLAIIDVTAERLSEMLGERSAGSGPVVSRPRMDVVLDASGDPVAGYVNVIGILPGSDPVLRDQLVLLAVNLDSGSYPARVPVLDSERSGIAAAALLEVARVLGEERRMGRGPARSVMFVWLAGSTQDDRGIQALVKTPPWPEDAVYRIYTAGTEVSEGSLLPRSFRVGGDALPGGEEVGSVGMNLAGRFYALVQSSAF
jgi:hypothetical protein